MKGGFYVSTRNAIIIVTLFVLIVVGVGLMAGLIREPCPETVMWEMCDEEEGGETPDDSPWLDPFLPNYTHPVHYELYLFPDFYFDRGTFYGSESIEIAIEKDTKYLLVHYKMMEITDTKVKDGDKQDLPMVRAFAYDDNQYWVTELRDIITAGSTVYLELEFTGSLNNGIVGWYKSNYTNSDTGEDSWLSTTKFQPSDARKAFPNFDEPRYKAQFTITQKHWANFTARSNMPEAERNEVEDGWVETTFERTVTMSSYLIAFIVTDFHYKTNYLNSGQEHRVWSTPDKLDQVDYALDMGKRVADWFEVYFNMSFHLPKLDEFAIPDYPSGATEHWGISTYREARLLYDKDQVGDYDKQRVATIVAHEHLHHYFGNAITCQWWDEIWLNEAPARFYEHMSIDGVTWNYTENVPIPGEYYDMMRQFVVRVQQGVMITDATESSRPVIVPINNPDEATQAFDGITYDKGASLLRMIENFMGDEIFRDGLRRFLKKHEYEPVSTLDLWASLQDEADDQGLDLKIEDIMTPWVMQMGLPLVTIEQQGGNLVAKQERFMNDPNADKDEPESPYSYEWEIPLTYTYEGASEPVTVWMEPGTELPIDDPRGSDDEWIKFNYQQMGFYRVNMPDTMWAKIAEELPKGTFDEIDSAHIMDDAFNLARAGRMEYDTVLDLSQYLENEKSYFPWQSAKRGMDYMGEMLYGNPDYGLWRDHVVKLSSPLMEDLTTEDGGEHMDKLNRNNAIDLACGHGHVECMTNITQDFVAWVQDENNEVSQNLRRKVYQHGMRATGGDEAWDTLWDRYVSVTSGQEKDNILYALSQTNKPWLIQKYLDYAWDPEKIRTQDFFTAIGYLAANPNANRHVWDWTRAMYDEMLDRFDLNDRYFGRMVPGIVDGYNTQFQLEEVEAFYKKYPDAGAGERAREQSLDSIRNNIDWVEANAETIINWLKDPSK